MLAHVRRSFRRSPACRTSIPSASVKRRSSMLHLVTGGAGFLGSHLTSSLVDDGHSVIVIDNFSPGHIRNLERGISSGRVTLVYADVAQPFAALRDLVAGA